MQVTGYAIDEVSLLVLRCSEVLYFVATLLVEGLTGSGCRTLLFADPVAAVSHSLMRLANVHRRWLWQPKALVHVLHKLDFCPVWGLGYSGSDAIRAASAGIALYIANSQSCHKTIKQVGISGTSHLSCSQLVRLQSTFFKLELAVLAQFSLRLQNQTAGTGVRAMQEAAGVKSKQQVCQNHAFAMSAGVHS